MEDSNQQDSNIEKNSKVNGDSTGPDKGKVEPKKISGARLWLFRLLAVTVVPALILVLAEMALRIVGFGYETDFMVKADLEGRDAYWENLKFGWRFFPKHLSRVPTSFVLDAQKSPETYRIFILGGSAAQGYPDFSFAFGRILEVMLQEQYPSVKFEVISAAVTAINSHVVLEIAQSCAQHDSDMFVIYMGNNEVVGPFGPGTVFKSYSPIRSVIRASVRLKTTKVGQLIDGILGLPAERKAPKKWAGMEMFLQKQIRADDPGMESAYSHFEANLNDMIRIARNSRTKVVLSTVGCDLKNCPPMASLHRPDITESQLREWELLYDVGVNLENAGNYVGAAEQYLQAEKIDPTFGDMEFRLGRCYWQNGEYEKAHESFVKARDADTLRFRSDTTINRIIREVANENPSAEVKLVDAVEILKGRSEHGITGEQFFWEHVHMNFDGNYLLARGIFDAVGQMLPEWVKKHKTEGDVLSRDDCAERLALTMWDRRRIQNKMVGVIETPPFTNQLYHFEHVMALRQQLAQLELYREKEQIELDRQMYLKAIENKKDDSWLYFNYGIFLQKSAKEPRAAVEILKTACLRMPQYAAAFNQLGVSVNELGGTDEAIGLFEKALLLRPNNAHILHNNLGVALQRKGDDEEAVAHYKKGIELDPNYVLTYNNIGALLNKQGKHREAVKYLSQAVRILPEFVQARRNLDSALRALQAENAAVQSPNLPSNDK